ncbi:MAG: NAD(P)/FAD-dependent oxidoreductase [Pseudomonadota bacterium]
MTERFDAVVIGAGHNGLVCATLLAQKGQSVLLLEANDRVGGAAVTREFADGFRVSSAAHYLYQLQPAVVRSINLEPPAASPPLRTTVLSGSGTPVSYRGGDVTGVSAADAQEFRLFYRQMTRFATLLSRHLNARPPRLGGGGGRDKLELLKLGFDVRRLGRSDMREFLRLIGMNMRDELVERFASPMLRGGLALDAVLGTHLGPRSPSSLLTYLYRLAGGAGEVTRFKGGMGALTGTMAELATQAGVDIRTGVRVQQVVVENGRVTGVRTTAGDAFDTFKVVSSVDPKSTVLDLVGAPHFETRFVHRVNQLRGKGNVAKLHLALRELPRIQGLNAKELSDRLLIAPDDDYVERAFNPAKYGEFSNEPVIELSFETLTDPTLAPAGMHVLSANVQYAPYDLKGGWTGAARSRFTDRTLDVLSSYMPNLDSLIGASELLTPVDLEREFHLPGGHWHHVELALDQFMFVRPVAGAAQYRLPVDGLWLCGAGAHPGGGVSGAPGRNAARAILAREKLRWRS